MGKIFVLILVLLVALADFGFNKMHIRNPFNDPIDYTDGEPGDDSDSIPQNDPVSAADSDLQYIREKGTLVVGVSALPPLDYLDGNGNWIGFDADLARAFAYSLGVDIEFVEIDWDMKITALDSKRIDCIWNALPSSYRESGEMSCSNDYIDWKQAVVVDQTNLWLVPDFNSVQEAALRIAVAAGFSAEDLAIQYGLDYTTYDSEVSALTAVADGQAEAAIIDALALKYLIGEDTQFPTLVNALYIGNDPCSVGFRNSSDVVEELNQFLKESYADGTMMSIAETYSLQDLIVPQF